jgi:hypothetical protein
VVGGSLDRGGCKNPGVSGTDLGVAIANVFVTAITAAVNAATGATLRFDRHLTVVCEGGWLSERGWSSAFTTGNTINVKADAAERLRNDPALLEHEWRHSVQWAALGPVGFLALYTANYFASQAISGCQCWNVFEWQAGFADGGYDCAGLGKAGNGFT